MTTQEFIVDLEKHVYCRLVPSRTEGVGVIAIRDIPKGTNPFVGCRAARWELIPWESVMRNPNIPDSVKKLAQDLYYLEGAMLHYPNHSLNDINISYFVNHADTPNVDVVALDEEEIGFIANRDIREGEELFADYREYVNIE